MSREEFERLFHSQRSYRASEKEAFIKGCEARQPEIDTLRARVAELEGDLSFMVEQYDLLIDKQASERLEASEKTMELLRRGLNPLASEASQPAPMVPDGWRKLLDMIVPRIDPTGLDEVDHCCEYTLYQDRERIHAEFAARLAAAPEVDREL